MSLCKTPHALSSSAPKTFGAQSSERRVEVRGVRVETKGWHAPPRDVVEEKHALAAEQERWEVGLRRRERVQ
eukprot:3555031-Rhodomonas_salina.1